MDSFGALYNQTITMFNRIPSKNGEPVMWIATVIDGVHLVVDKSSSWSSNGGRTEHNATLHIRYQKNGQDANIRCKAPDGTNILKKWYEPKAWRNLINHEEGITFSFGDNEDFDFFMEGVFDEVQNPISDQNFERKGLYGYINLTYDNVFAVASVRKCNLIPHFEISGR